MSNASRQIVNKVWSFVHVPRDAPDALEQLRGLAAELKAWGLLRLFSS